MMIFAAQDIKPLLAVLLCQGGPQGDQVELTQVSQEDCSFVAPSLGTPRTPYDREMDIIGRKKAIGRKFENLLLVVSNQ